MSRTVAILGTGKIGESLLAGLLSSAWRTPDEIVVTGRREERVRELEERYGVRGTLSNAEAVQGAALVVIAVKPQDFDVLLGEIGGVLTPEQTVLSVAAAIPTAQIEARTVMAEAAHGTAPSLRGKNVANPMATILAGAALLGYGDEQAQQAGRAIREACLEAVADGIRTADLGGGAATTEFTDEVIRRVRQKLEV